MICVGGTPGALKPSPIPDDIRGLAAEGGGKLTSNFASCCDVQVDFERLLVIPGEDKSFMQAALKECPTEV